MIIKKNVLWQKKLFIHDEYYFQHSRNVQNKCDISMGHDTIHCPKALPKEIIVIIQLNTRFKWSCLCVDISLLMSCKCQNLYIIHARIPERDFLLATKQRIIYVALNSYNTESCTLNII